MRVKRDQDMANADQVRGIPRLNSVLGFGPMLSTPAILALHFSGKSIGGFIGGSSGKVLPTEKIRS